jgi:DNA-binding CsgD family transcriptional regulator
MSDCSHARSMIKQLSEAELDALGGLADGESLRDLARRSSMSEVGAKNLLNSVKGKLGAVRNAEAVRIYLTAAGIED